MYARVYTGVYMLGVCTALLGAYMPLLIVSTMQYRVTARNLSCTAPCLIGKSLKSTCRALLSVHTALLSVYTALLSVYSALLRQYRVPDITYVIRKLH